MGRQKLALPLRDGKSMLQHVLSTAASAGLDGLLVVVGDEGGAAAQAAIDPAGRWQVVYNLHPEQGMSRSLRLGVEMLERSTVDAVLVLLGDQPDVSAAVISRVAEEFRATGASLVQPSYRGQPGHPVLFARCLFPELLQVTGDEGGRSVVRAHREQRHLVTVDREMPVDLDTPDAYEAWLRMQPDGEEPKD